MGWIQRQNNGSLSTVFGKLKFLIHEGRWKKILWRNILDITETYLLVLLSWNTEWICFRHCKSHKPILRSLHVKCECTDAFKVTIKVGHQHNQIMNAIMWIRTIRFLELGIQTPCIWNGGVYRQASLTFVYAFLQAERNAVCLDKSIFIVSAGNCNSSRIHYTYADRTLYSTILIIYRIQSSNIG